MRIPAPSFSYAGPMKSSVVAWAETDCTFQASLGDIARPFVNTVRRRRGRGDQATYHVEALHLFSNPV